MKSQAEKTERVTILMPESDARLLRHAAVDAGKSTSAVVRNALRPILESRQEHDDKRIVAR
jgi:Arc/MetJ-type ribon-helix-helix transcriptional regulator